MHATTTTFRECEWGWVLQSRKRIECRIDSRAIGVCDRRCFVESACDSKLGLNFAFADGLLSVRIVLKNSFGIVGLCDATMSQAEGQDDAGEE